LTNEELFMPQIWIVQTELNGNAGEYPLVRLAIAIISVAMVAAVVSFCFGS